MSSSVFPPFIEEGCLYVDKSAFIEHFLSSSVRASLICRQRRLGKSLNMDMLYRFLTESEDCRPLFEKLYIRNSPYWEKAHSAPVFWFNLKN